MQTPPVFKKQEMIRVSKLAERWQCSRQHIYNLIDKGESCGGLFAFRCGKIRGFLIPISAIVRFEEKSAVNSNE